MEERKRPRPGSPPPVQQQSQRRVGPATLGGASSGPAESQDTVTCRLDSILSRSSCCTFSSSRMALGRQTAGEGSTRKACLPQPRGRRTCRRCPQHTPTSPQHPETCLPLGGGPWAQPGSRPLTSLCDLWASHRATCSSQPSSARRPCPHRTEPPCSQRPCAALPQPSSAWLSLGLLPSGRSKQARLLMGVRSASRRLFLIWEGDGSCTSPSSGPNPEATPRGGARRDPQGRPPRPLWERRLGPHPPPGTLSGASQKAAVPRPRLAPLTCTSHPRRRATYFAAPSPEIRSCSLF